MLSCKDSVGIPSKRNCGAVDSVCFFLGGEGFFGVRQSGSSGTTEGGYHAETWAATCLRFRSNCPSFIHAIILYMPCLAQKKRYIHTNDRSATEAPEAEILQPTSFGGWCCQCRRLPKTNQSLSCFLLPAQSSRNKAANARTFESLYFNKIELQKMVAVIYIRSITYIVTNRMLKSAC